MIGTMPIFHSCFSLSLYITTVNLLMSLLPDTCPFPISFEYFPGPMVRGSSIAYRLPNPTADSALPVRFATDGIMEKLKAIFLAVRLYCSFVMEYDIHTLLDLATLGTTLWVIFMIRFKLRPSYMEDKDNFALYYVLVLALLIHPSTSHNILNRISWALCVYLEAVSVLPQLQNTKIVEPVHGGIMYLHLE